MAALNFDEKSKQKRYEAQGLPAQVVVQEEPMCTLLERIQSRHQRLNSSETQVPLWLPLSSCPVPE